MVCCTIANMAMITARSQTRFLIKDFLLKFDDERGEVPKKEKGQSKGEVDRLKLIAKMWTALSQVEKK